MRTVSGLLVTVSLLLCLKANAQHKTFTLQINDIAAIPAITQNYPEVTLNFADPGLTTIASHYHIYNFEQAAPEAPTEHMRQLWLVEVDSLGLMNELLAYDPQLFPWADTPTIATSTAVPPNDPLFGNQGELSYVHIPEAWLVSEGDTSIKIAICELYGTDNLHDEIKGKYRSYNNLTIVDNHATAVSGMAAAATNNGIGLAGAGYNCHLILNARGGTNFTYTDMLTMIRNFNAKVINTSWTAGVLPDFTIQGYCNTIYEEGATFVGSAGNGYENNPAELANPDKSPRQAVYPASYEHNISVTNVGWKNNRGSGIRNIKDVFDNEIGDSLKRYNYNSKVDICAPASDISLLFRSSAGGYGVADGTSFASPMVCGVIGLMQSAFHQRFNDFGLSPYQVEYILKNTATLLDTVAENVPFAGMLGAGALHAGKAVAASSLIDPNDPASQSFIIDGVSTDLLCKPDSSDNVARPHLTVTMHGGTAPYSYIWESISGNSAALDNYAILNPTVVSVGANNTLRYRLTIRDNSPIQKIANKEVKIVFKTGAPKYDLAMRDHYADMGMEPNYMDSTDRRDWDIWRSPDIWNRKHNDAGLDHENPEYYLTDSNYIYVRVRNLGCKTYEPVSNSISTTTERLRVYWTLASTGENWPDDWNGNTLVPGTAVGTYLPGGGELTASNPVTLQKLDPGQDTVIVLGWRPSEISQYTSEASLPVCLLARNVRFFRTNSNPSGNENPGIVEDVVVKKNVRNSNSVVTRNLVITNLDPKNISVRHQVFFANPYNVSGTYNIRINDIRDRYKYLAGDYGAIGNVKLYLGGLYGRWLDAGKLGNYYSYDESEKSVTFTSIRNMSLEGLEFEANEKFPVMVEFTLKDASKLTVPSTHMMNLTQFDNDNVMIGNITFEVNVNNQGSGDHGEKQGSRTGEEPAIVKSEKLTVYPNPTYDGLVYLNYHGKELANVKLTLTDLAGKAVFSTRISTLADNQPVSVRLPELATGVYELHVKTNKGQLIKTVKLVIAHQ